MINKIIRDCLAAAAISLAAAGCGSTGSNAAPMDAEVIRAGVKARVSEQTLRAGRMLFVSRCVECHTLPVISDHSLKAWPHLVDTMAGRADLKPGEHQALTAYILAVRAQEK
jgi:mono/diheme cytochrome c family protein